MPESSLVSVIVPTKNSAATIAACLGSIREQSYELIELMVVDNHSEDKTVAVAEQFTDKVFVQGPERCTQRNFGAQKANGEYFMFIDSDMVLGADVVQDCVRVLSENESAVGVIIPEESFGRGFWADCKKLERSYYVGVDWMEAARFFRREAFDTVGGYDEMLVSGEDWDLSQRIQKVVGPLARTKEFIRHNEGQPTLIGLLKKKWYYAGKIAAYSKKREHDAAAGKQMGLLSRYGLFFSRPGKLFKKPLVGLGMLFMKTSEFAVGGVAYVLACHRSGKV